MSKRSHITAIVVFVFTSVCLAGVFDSLSTAIGWTTNPKVMDIAVGDNERDLKKSSWFKTCVLLNEDELDLATKSKFYECKNPNTVTDDIMVGMFKGKIRYIRAHFSQPTKHTEGSRSPSIDAFEAISSKFGKPHQISDDIMNYFPNDLVLSKCAVRGGCKVYYWISKKPNFEVKMFTSSVGLSGLGFKDGLMELIYIDMDANDEFIQIRDDVKKKLNSAKATNLGL